MTKKAGGIRVHIRIKGKKLEIVNQFKYLSVIVTDEGSNPEILARVAQATHVMS